MNRGLQLLEAPEVLIPGADQKDRGLWRREWLRAGRRRTYAWVCHNFDQTFFKIRTRNTQYIATYAGEPTWLAKRTPDLLRFNLVEAI